MWFILLYITHYQNIETTMKYFNFLLLLVLTIGNTTAQENQLLLKREKNKYPEFIITHVSVKLSYIQTIENYKV